MSPDAQPPPRRRRKRAAVLITVVAAVLGAVAVLVPVAAGTQFANELLDRRTIAFMASVAARAAPAPAGAQAPAAAQASLPWTTAAELEALTRPPARALAVAAEPLARHRLSGAHLIQESITFPSAIALRHPESNVARAYVYRHGRLGERPVVLWVPGQYVVDLAFPLISYFTGEITRRGADVVLLVPPYHLERSPAGFESGDAVLATTLADHLGTFAQELSDLRRLAGWLRAQGVPVLGGFGGLVGAMLLLRMTTWDRSLDFATVFIPMIRLSDLLARPDAEPMRLRILREGHSLAEVERLYAVLDPTSGAPLMDPLRVSVLYGRYDQVAPPPATQAWARAWGVTRLHAYDRGHTLALFTPSLYRDYARLLDEDLRAFSR